MSNYVMIDVNTLRVLIRAADALEEQNRLLDALGQLLGRVADRGICVYAHMGDNDPHQDENTANPT